jgi:hypothetical protein
MGRTGYWEVETKMSKVHDVTIWGLAQGFPVRQCPDSNVALDWTRGRLHPYCRPAALC